MKHITVTQLRKYLKNKTDKELIQEIVDLFKISPKAKEYFSLKVNPDLENDLLEQYKEIVEKQFFPARGNSVLNYTVLKKAISDFEKVAKNPENIAELMMWYVDNGVEFTNTYGDINETFYNNIARMYNKAVSYILNQDLEYKFKERCKRAMENSRNIGWGFGIFMEDCYYDAFLDDED